MSCQLKNDKSTCPVCGFPVNPIQSPVERCPRCGSLLGKGCETCSGCSIMSVIKHKKS